MKKILLILLVAIIFSLALAFYFLDKSTFLCPIEYKKDIIVRCDGRGDGFFAAERSGNRLHQGIDLYAAIGIPVFASRSGIVIAARRTRGMGNYVIIRHAGSITTLYGHLYRIDVNKGQFVRQGQIVGAVGKTGNANYRDILPHLHFEVRKKGVPQDPLEYLE